MLIKIYEASQRETHEELDRRSKGIDDGLATINSLNNFSLNTEHS